MVIHLSNQLLVTLLFHINRTLFLCFVKSLFSLSSAASTNRKRRRTRRGTEFRVWKRVTRARGPPSTTSHPSIHSSSSVYSVRYLPIRNLFLLLPSVFPVRSPSCCILQNVISFSSILSAVWLREAGREPPSLITIRRKIRCRGRQRNERQRGLQELFANNE